MKFMTTWRRQRKQGEIDALTAKRRGLKVVLSPVVKKNRDLQADVVRLTKKLKNAELIIEVQKKWRRCWANRFRTSRSTRRTYDRRLGVRRQCRISGGLPCPRRTARHAVPAYAAIRSGPGSPHAGAGIERG